MKKIYLTKIELKQHNTEVIMAVDVYIEDNEIITFRYVNCKNNNLVSSYFIKTILSNNLAGIDICDGFVVTRQHFQLIFDVYKQSKSEYPRV